MPLELNSCIVRFPDLMSTAVDKEVVILSLVANHYVGLDEMGKRIWDLLETPQPVSELCRLLANEFNSSVEQVCSDLLPFLSKLDEEGLVHAVAD